MATDSGIALGVNVVQEHSRWVDALSLLEGKVTLELVTPIGILRKAYVITAADVVAFANAIIALGRSLGVASGVPMGRGFPTGSTDYDAPNTGTWTVEELTADQGQVGDTPPEYDYIEAPP